MKRLSSCIVWGWMSKGEGKKFYLSANPTTKTCYTDDLGMAKTLPYDVAWSIAKRQGLYVESRF